MSPAQLQQSSAPCWSHWSPHTLPRLDSTWKSATKRKINAGAGPSSLCTNCRQNPIYLANDKGNAGGMVPHLHREAIHRGQGMFKHASYNATGNSLITIYTG
jgi:hypothetical protein